MKRISNGFEYISCDQQMYGLQKWEHFVLLSLPAEINPTNMFQVWLTDNANSP
jgi:hypothetical protein